MMGKIKLLWYYLFSYPYYKLVMGRIGSRTKLFSPKLTGASAIFLGDKVYIQTGSWLAADPVTGEKDCSLVIGDGTYIGRFCHIYATGKISIGKKVLIADKVYISDNMHGYRDVTMPVIDQPVRQLKAVSIGDGAWIGENACVVGAAIGRNSVVGANAVVTSDVPDFCVVAGIPAKIIRRYDFDKNEWRKTNEEGAFLG